jgi:hypothetical protein
VHRQGLRAKRRRSGRSTRRRNARVEDRGTAIELDVNGATRQKADLKDLIWNVPETIEHLSAAWTLQPGDLIFTGTPAGVAAVVRATLMEGRIAGLGALQVRWCVSSKGVTAWRCSSSTTSARRPRTACASRWP